MSEGFWPVVIGVVLGAILTQLNSIASDWRSTRKNEQALVDEERAVFSGAFSICNFVAERLNLWDENKTLSNLARLQTAQFYLNRLIDRSPPSSDRLLVSLIDLGLRIESLLFALGIGPYTFEKDGSLDCSAIDHAVEELAGSLETTQLILGDPLAIASVEELFDSELLGRENFTEEDARK